MIINDKEYTLIGSQVTINSPCPDCVLLFFMVDGGADLNKTVMLNFDRATEFWANWTSDEQAYDELRKELGITEGQSESGAI